MIWRVLVVGLVLMAACTSDSTRPSAPSSSSTTPTYTPVFATSACTDEVPHDARIECGTLTVPEDRSRPDGRKVVMPVAVVHTADRNPASDPVVYLSGGPGGAALPAAGNFLANGQAGNRDVILIDQRGTGRSDPRLDCPEVNQAFSTILEDNASFDAETKIGTDSLHVCLDRLRADGVDLNQYNTATVADDIADLRVAMGIKEWNLYGVSYGTMDALVTMRAHPEGIRSVVLDSVVPPDVGTGAPETAASFERVKKVLFDGCARDPRCNAKYPNLEADLDDAVQELDANPYHGAIQNPVLQHPAPITITGADAAAGLFDALYETSLIPQLPGIIELVHSGNGGPIIDPLAMQSLEFVTSFNAAQAAAVNCYDRAAFQNDGDAARVVAQVPDDATLLLFGIVPCGDVGVAPAPTGFNDPVRSDIPTLVLAGEYDPVTPPEQSKHASETLSRSTFVEFPGMGHGVVFAQPACPVAIFRAFLAAPGDPVDTSCVATMGPPNWAV